MLGNHSLGKRMGVPRGTTEGPRYPIHRSETGVLLPEWQCVVCWQACIARLTEYRRRGSVGGLHGYAKPPFEGGGSVVVYSVSPSDDMSRKMTDQ